MDPFGRVVLQFVPEEFMDRYAYNEYARAIRRRPNFEYRGRCYQCRARGVLWVDLKFRGFPRPYNFLCNQCWAGIPDDDKKERRHRDTILYLRNRERRLARMRAGHTRKAP